MAVCGGARGRAPEYDFVDIVTFDALAKTVAEHLTKGRLVAVIGRLRHSQWTTAEGEKRSKVGVVADGIVRIPPEVLYEYRTGTAS